MEAIREQAEQQAGVVSRRQLRARGLTDDAIDHRLRRGLLHPLLRGVYAVGHRQLRPEGWWWAAVLAGGPAAILSHQAAAMAHRLIALPPGPATDAEGRPVLPLHITVPTHRRSQPGLEVHRGRVDRRDRTSIDGLAMTNVSRTLLDLADTLEYRSWREVTDATKHLNTGILRSTLTRTPGRRGAGSVKRLLVSEAGGVTKSVLERRLGPFLAAHGLRQPDARNAWVVCGYADAVWWDEQVALELDSRAWHSREAERRQDRRRDRVRAAQGWGTPRIVPEDLQPEWATDTARELGALLQVEAGHVRRARAR